MSKRTITFLLAATLLAATASAQQTSAIEDSDATGGRRHLHADR